MYIRLIKKPESPNKFIKFTSAKVYEFYVRGRKEFYLAKDFIDEPGGFRKLRLANGNKILVAESYIVSVMKKQLVQVISELKISNTYNSQYCNVNEYYLVDHDDLFILEDYNSEDQFLKPYKVEKTISVTADNRPTSDHSSKNPLKILV
jgi:hypothetical protein